MTYDLLGRMQTRRNALNQQTQYQYNALGQTVAITDADGVATRYGYDAAGNTTWETDARNQTTHSGYDDANRLTSIQFANSTAITMTYNHRGQKLTETNQRGMLTRWVYDTAGRLTSMTVAEGTPDAATTLYGYNAINERTSVTDARSTTTTTTSTYNATTHEKLLTVTRPMGQVTQTSFNAAGQRIRQRDALNHLTTFAYNPRGVQTLTTFHDGSTMQQLPDGAGRIVQATDQDSKTTVYGYDAAGRLTSVTNPASETTSYGYDAANNLTSVTDANQHTTSFGYNGRGLRSTQTLPLGQTETTVYDAVGNATHVTDFNGTTTVYHYDALNRLDTITPDASLNQPGVVFTFTPTGQRATMVDGTGTTSYGYDAQDRLTSKATPQGTLSYSYDPNGNVLTVRSSHSNGMALDYRYDVLNRLDQVTDTRLNPGVTSYGYDAVGNLTTTTQPNGVLTTASYNAVDQLTNVVTAKHGTTLTSFAYTLRPSGLRTQIIEQDGRTSSYGYDDAQRLLSEIISGATPSGTIAYTYDDTGNRLTRTSSVAGIANSSASYDANDRIAGVSYDNNGNIVSADGVTYSYDYANRLIASSTGVTIGYNGDGVRVSETVNGMTTQYLVDENNPTGYAQVVEELRNGAVQTRYTYGRDLISQTYVGAGATSFYSYDGLGRGAGKSCQGKCLTRNRICVFVDHVIKNVYP